jgi:hypothetical protein
MQSLITLSEYIETLGSLHYTHESMLLALCNLPKAERQSQRQHQNHFESWI